MKRAAGVVVELCGLPGSGKSLLAAALLDDLRRRGVAARSGGAEVGPEVGPGRRVARKLAAAARALVDDPAGTTRACAAAARSQRGLVERASRSLQWAATQGLLRRARRGRAAAVFDEGIVQALWSAGLRGDLPTVLGALEADATWRGPDILAVVDVPPRVAAGRLERRSSTHSRTQQLADADRSAELERGEELLHALVAWWRRCAPPGAEIVSLANADDGPPNGAISLLADAVAERLGSVERRGR